MATTYASVEDVADLLRIPITATTIPNKAQIEKIINRKEDEFDRRTGHAWRSKTKTRELHDLPLLYTFGWGTPVFLHHRNIYELDGSAGDKIEIWEGASSSWSNILGSDQWYDIEYEYGTIHLRGFIFSILRKNRVRITYRYGGEEFAGDTVVPDDIKDGVIKLTAIDLMNTSFRMDEIPTGGIASVGEAKRMWQEDVERMIENRREVFVIP